MHGAIQEDCSLEMFIAPICFPVGILPGLIHPLFLASKTTYCVLLRRLSLTSVSDVASDRSSDQMADPTFARS